MKKIYYEKVGRRYVPVREYDSDFIGSFNKGAHLVMCVPGGQSTHFNVDPALAPMIAAGQYAEDAMSKAVVRASQMRSQDNPVTQEQRDAWEALAKSFGKELAMLEWPSAREIAKEGVKAMQQEAEKLLKYASVREAYDHFMLMAKLASEESK